MSSLPVKRLATLEDLQKLPDNVVGEIIQGELIVSPRPSSPHARAATRLGSRLGPAFDEGIGGPGGWILLFEPELHLGGNVLVPDWAGWRRERMPQMPQVAAFEIVPDWVCEILSPATAVIDREVKMPTYARVGVSHAWLLDPTLKTLEVFRLDGQLWRWILTASADRKVKAEPFDALELDLSPLWAR